ncbi:MAG: hypothetical protein WBB28_20840 [Crinalium sp.]
MTENNKNKNKEKIRDRLSIDLGDLRSRLLQWSDERDQPIGSMVRSAIRLAMDILETTYKMKLPAPKPGDVENWIRSLMTINGNPQSTDTLPTIADLLKNQDLQEASDRSGLTERRIQELVDGRKPIEAELSLLERMLPLPLEKLLLIYKRDFANTHHKELR